MIDSYIELKSFKCRNKKVFSFILIITFFIIIYLFFLKIKTYKSYTVIRGNNSNYVLCEKDCDELKSNNFFQKGEKKIKYNILSIKDNIYEIDLLDNIHFKDYLSVGVVSKKTSAINFLLNIFRRRE